MAAAAVDIGYLAASYHVPEPTLHELLSAPTIELVQTVLAQLEAKAREFDDLKSDKLRIDVELETEVRNGDLRARALRASADRASKHAAELDQKLLQEATARAQLDAELQALKTSASQSTSENRDAIALHETKSAAHDRLADDLSAQHQKAVALRKDVAELESRFREQTLKQEIELLKKNNDYYEDALKKRQEDQTKFRKEKNAQTIDSLQRTDTAHRKRLDELAQRNEELIGRIQHVQDAAVQDKQSSRAELDNAANTAKAHIHELKAQLEQTNEGAAQEIGQLQAELESERNQKEAAEVRVAQLEAQVEQLETHIAGLSRPTIPGTPRRTLNGGLGTPGRAASPGIFSPSRSKNGPSQTQLYAENATLKKQSAAFSEMLSELEARQPEIEELRQENERLTDATSEIQALLDQALADKDAARKESRKHLGENKGLLRQYKLMEQEVRDNAAQVRFLLTYQKADEREYFINRINGTVPEEQLDDTTPTGRLISRHLVVFKSVEEMQAQHAEGLKMMRNVADQYEGSEAQQKAAVIEEDKMRLSALEEKVSKYEDDLRSLTLRCQSLTKERDLFRKIVTDRRHGQDTDAASVFGQSIDGRVSATSPVPSVLQASQSGGPDYEKLLRELQAHMDNLKQESETDYKALKQQADTLAKANSDLQSENVRLSSSIQLATDRLNDFQQRYRELQTNAETINNRYNTQQERAARQDILTQKAAEDLIAAQQAQETLERRIRLLEENEKFAKTTQTRLVEESAKLQNERDQLHKQVEDNREIFRETSDNQRHLKATVESLQKDLQLAKDKLDEEIRAHQHTSQKYESDRFVSQKSIDDYSQTLNNIRVELATVKAERDQVRLRVEEQKAELAMERERSLQARPAPRVNGSAEEHGENVEMLKSDLATARENIRVLNGDIEKYQSIAQDAEEQLADAQNSWEDVKIQDLQQRVGEISAELATTNTELSELRRAHEDENIQFAQQKEDLDAQIARLQDDADRYKETAALHKEDLKAQGEITKRAQENYEHELMKHGEAMKNLQDTREKYNQLKTEVVQYKSEAEAARASLEQMEEHLVQLRERHEKDLADHRAKHTDFENVSADIATLKSNRISVAAGDTGLQSVIRYLRHEKEVVEMEHELSKQDVKRTKQQLEYAQEQLDQTREKLGALQQDQIQDRQNAMSLDRMQKQVEELNLYRESTSTLRNDNRQLRTQVAEKTKEVDVMNEQLQPLRARTGELELLQQDRDHWQKRHQDVLLKYDRIDPAELEALKTQISTLQAERDEANKAVQKLTEETESAKDARRELSNKKDEALQALGLERDGLQQQLESSQTELAQAIAARDEALANLETRPDTVMANGPEEGQVNETGLGQEEKQALEARIANANAEIYAERNKTVEQNIKAQALESNAQSASAGSGEVSESSEEVQSLKDQLAASQKLIDDLSTRADITDSGSAEHGSKSVAGQNPEQVNNKVVEAEKRVAELEARVKELEVEIAGERRKAAEAETHSTEADVRAAERMKNLKEKCNKMVKDAREEMRETKQKYESAIAELERVRQEAQTSVPESTVAAPDDQTTKEPTSSVSDTPVKAEIEELDPEWDERQVKNWVARNKNVLEILGRNITTKATKAVSGLCIEATNFTNLNQVKPVQENLDAALAKLKEEETAKAKLISDQESIIAEKVKEGQAKTEKMIEMKYKIKLSTKDSQLLKAQTKIDVVEKAANETPEKPVKEVWEIAQAAKPTPTTATPAPAVLKPAPQLPVVTQTAVAATAPSAEAPTEAVATAQTASPFATQLPIAPVASNSQTAGISQSNGPNVNASNQPGGFRQPSFGQPQQGIPQPQAFGRPSSAMQNPFQQQALNMGQVPNQGAFGGASGMPQPGFVGNSQMPQNAGMGMGMQTFSGARGGGAFGTGPGALRNLQQGAQQQVQTGIPRGGGIPRPAGRGGNQANANQGHGGGNFQDGNARGGRGGRGGFNRDRGGRGGTPGSEGRGGAPNSPLNPSAQQFLPGPANNTAGRGQKRTRDSGAEGEGDGGNKRVRGGRGGGAQ
ncbi:hypothetical protein P154DRAFT_557010 [Amniculicola lignicola CBS 123094]|uniref:Uncharacterized protein n=1 Tax=Amniculicola lignicola CBS 123094 TaxID=1392246 RepID=A0A6A5VZN0_9PLEO|nr:hypothetical protein P154DRAFT_557010 [Amniculicola lignicola CBS 123094]